MRLEQVHRTYLQNETVSKLMTKKKLLPGGALKKFHKIHTKCQKKKKKKKKKKWMKKVNIERENLHTL